MSACHEFVEPSLSIEEAEAVIWPYFFAAQEVFLKAGFSRCKKTNLEISPLVHDSPRHFAACEDTGRRIIFAPVAAAILPPETLAAIALHEFGHATDFLYPTEFLLVDDGELIRLPSVPEGKLINKKAEQANLARRNAWERIHASEASEDKDAVERTADAIAEMISGIKIGYCGPCELQCFSRGRPRRAGLR